MRSSFDFLANSDFLASTPVCGIPKYPGLVYRLSRLQRYENPFSFLVRSYSEIANNPFNGTYNRARSPCLPAIAIVTTHNMVVFIDTEFTSLNEPYLISAALVVENGRELYFEMSGISSMVCSTFVVDNVLPLLEGPVITPIEAAKQVADFLGSAGDTVTLFCDAPRYDVELLKPFLPANVRWKVAVPSFETEEEETVYRTAYESAFMNGLRRHHALDDARAMQRAWQAIHLKKSA